MPINAIRLQLKGEDLQNLPDHRCSEKVSTGVSGEAIDLFSPL